MFGSRMLRRIFGASREEVMIECREPHNDDLGKLYCLPDTVTVIRSRMVRCTSLSKKYPTFGQENKVLYLGGYNT
jgi:hypothetical protein